MNFEDLNVLASRAFSYIEDDQSGKAIDILLSAAELAFNLAEENSDSVKKSELIDIGNEYLSLADDIIKNLAAKEQKAISSTTSNVNEADKDWRFEIPSIDFDDVIGMDNLKKEINEKLIIPSKDQNQNSLANQYNLPRGFGLLLYGPTGTGKTFFASAIAGELGWPLFVISGSAIISKYVGESEKHLMQLFTQAKSYERSVIFIDEIETIFPNRKIKDLQQYEKKLAGELLTQLDGIDPVDNWMLIIGASNNPNDLDEALLRDGRLGIHAFVGLPDKDLIVEMLKREMQNVNVIGDIQYNEIADKLAGLTLNSVKHIAEETRSIAYARDTEYYNQHPEVKPVARGIKAEDFDKAIANRNPIRISEQTLAEFKSFQERHLGHINA